MCRQALPRVGTCGMKQASTHLDSASAAQPYLLGAAAVVACVWLGASLLSEPEQRAGSGALQWIERSGDTAQGPEQQLARSKEQEYLAMCLITRNQHQDMREWVGHHISVGASRVYLYDHLSDPPLNDVLVDYIANGIVHYTRWEHNHDYYEELNKDAKQPKTNAQREMHTHCLRTHGHRHQFLGLLDSDEFLVINDGSPSVPDQLRRMMAWEPIGGLAIFWRVFGSGGRETRPEEGVLKGFTKCANATARWTNSVKTLANTDYAVAPSGHIVELNTTSVHVVTEHFRRLKVGFNGNHPGNATWDHLAVHHYLTKSREEFSKKARRRAGDGSSRSWAEFKAINADAVHDCPQAEHYGPYP